MDDLQSLRRLSIGIAIGGEFGGGGGGGKARQRGRTAGQHVGCAQRAQIPDQIRQTRESYVEGVAVGDRHSETGTEQQIPGGPHVDLRMDARRGAAAGGEVAGHHRPFQSRQAAGAGEGGEEQAVGTQRAADQDQGARQVVDGVQRTCRHDEIEARIAERQAIFVALRAGIAARKCEARIGRGDRHAARGQRFGDSPVGAAEIERFRQGPSDQPDPFDELVGHEPAQIIGAALRTRRAIAAHAAQPAVEGAVVHPGLVPVGAVGDKPVMQLMALAQHTAHSILDFALPPRCPGCGSITGQAHNFCLDCWMKLDFLGEPCCACCGVPFAYEGDNALCGGCLAEPPRYDRLRAAVAYGPIARQVALKLKYGRRPGVAETLASFMLRHVRDMEADAILAPVPLHRWRIWKRGYNQAALIASALARRSGRPCSLALFRRRRATPSLRGLGRRERALAVRGAFEVPAAHVPLIAGRTVILVDDVYTSGATANACARALKRAGAGKVNMICWARVVAGDDHRA